MAVADSDPPTRAMAVDELGGSPLQSRAVGRHMGGYLILEEIASGGMATVHLARTETGPDAGRFVAIKRMHEHFAQDSDFASMFLDEATLCTRIRHENVVATIDVVQEEEELLLVLELVDGESLSKLVKQLSARKSRVPKHIASAIARDMLQGLHAAHEATNEAGEALMIVHRDVSPHNVIVGTDGVVKVLDFGVAKARGRVQQTQKGQLKGKLAYMSPEQARGKPVDRRSDVFSSGIVLWELLAGRRLFDGDNEGALLVAILSQQPKRLETIDPELAPYAELVHKALEMDPDGRYATALVFAEEIAKVIPCASRNEVAQWVKGEARLALARREAMVSRAKSRAASRAAAKAGTSAAAIAPRAPPGRLPPPATPSQRGPLPAPTPPPRASSPHRSPAPPIAEPPTTSDATVEDMWDTSTTTQDVESPAARLSASHAPPMHGALPVPQAPRSTGGTVRPPPTPTFGSPAPNMIPPMGAPPAMPGPGGAYPARNVSHLALAQTMPASALAASLGTSTPPSGPVSSTAFAWQAPTSGGSPRSSGAVLTPATLAAQSFDRMSYDADAIGRATPGDPPPLDRDQVRRLTLIAGITAGVTMVAAIAMLAILARKPWQPPPTPAAKSAPLLVGQVERTAALMPTTTPTAAASSAPTTATAAPNGSTPPPSPPSLQTSIAPTPPPTSSPPKSGALPKATSKPTSGKPTPTKPTSTKPTSTKPRR